MTLLEPGGMAQPRLAGCVFCIATPSKCPDARPAHHALSHTTPRLYMARHRCKPWARWSWPLWSPCRPASSRTQRRQGKHPRAQQQPQPPRPLACRLSSRRSRRAAIRPRSAGGRRRSASSSSPATMMTTT
jgi:hypothetical protein